MEGKDAATMAKDAVANAMSSIAAVGSGAEAWRRAMGAVAAAPSAATGAIDRVAEAAADWGRRAWTRVASATREAMDSEAVVRARTSFEAASETCTRHERHAISATRAAVLGASRAYPEATAAGGAALLLLALPVTRGLIVRNTFQRLRSSEALRKSAQRREAVIKEKVVLQMQEAEKLLERAKFAKEEFVNAQTKVWAARKQLESLNARLQSTAGATLGMDRRFMSPDVIRNQVRKKARVVERAIKDIDCHLL